MSSKTATVGAKAGGAAFQVVGDSAELVAYKLLQDVLILEGRSVEGARALNRRLLLEAYADCLEVAKGGRHKKVAVEPAP